MLLSFFQKFKYCKNIAQGSNLNLMLPASGALIFSSEMIIRLQATQVVINWDRHGKWRLFKKHTGGQIDYILGM